MTAVTSLDVAAWPAISLQQVEADVALLTRVDRKYIVTRAELSVVLDEVGDALRALEIDGERIFRYRSTYFDTPDLASYRAAAAGRSQRFKVRTRTYVTTGTLWLEVKLRDRRGQTNKHRVEHLGEFELDARAVAFLDGFTQLRPFVPMMHPSIGTTYERVTLVCSAAPFRGVPDAEQRVTIDIDVTCRHPEGTPIASLGEYLIVETKSHTARPGPVDRALWHIGARPVPISKYAVGVSWARPELSANRWRPILHRYTQLAPNH